MTNGLLATLFLSACGGGGSPSDPGTALGPTAPSAPTAPAAPTSGPRILLAGQSNAYFLQSHLFEPVADINIGGSIDYWLASAAFADKARTPGIEAFVWWQGAGDSGRATVDSYATRLRALIATVRAAHPGLPVRIVELLNTPERAIVRDAQRQVAADPGVAMILTGDLPLDGSGEHFTAAGYQAVRDRIYESIGR